MSDDHNIKKKKKKRDKDKEQEIESVEEHNIQDSSTEGIKKKKKKKSKDNSDLEEQNIQEQDISKKKKKKRHCHDEDNEGLKKNKKELDISNESDEEEIVKKKKKKRSHEDASDDDVKKKTKKKKKERVSDDEDSKDKGVKPFAGQWANASLGGDQRNDKFLRLMGGFKAKNTSQTSNSKFGSLALDAKREDRLNKGLQHQYEQAWETTREKRGKGLGFEESEEKKPSFSF